MNLKLCLLTAAVTAVTFSTTLRAQSTAWGNSFNVGSTSGSLSVTATNIPWTTFTASSELDVSSIWINSNSAMAAATGVRVEIFAVDLVTGKPTGPALATQVLASAAAGWTQVTGINYTLTEGSVYALQLSAASGNPAYNWRFLNSNLAAPYENRNFVQPYSGNLDPYWARGNNNNDPVQSGVANWLMQSSGGDSFGQPYNANLSQNIASPTVAIGQRFRFDAPDAASSLLDSVDLMLSVAATPPANPVTVRLLSSSGAILATSTLDLSSAASGINIYTVDFASSIQLTDQEFYFLALYSNGSAANSVVWRGGSTDVLTDIFLDATFQGQDGYAVTWNSQSDFSTVASTTLARDYYFNLNLSAIPEPSSLALLAAGLLTLAVRRAKHAKRRA